MNTAWAERVRGAWEDLRDHPGRAVLQSLGVVLGVASVVGGFSITDSFRRQAEQRYVRTGGLDKLTVYPEAGVRGSQPSAMQGANLGLRSADAERGAVLDPRALAGVSVVREVQAMVRTHSATRWRVVTGINADFIPLEAYVLERGRAFAPGELQAGVPVAILGSEAAQTFFPDGDAMSRTLVMDGIPVAVVGTFQPKVFRFLESDPNLFAWRNRTIVVPAAFVQKRLQADPYQRLDVITFRVPDTGQIEAFSRDLATLLRANHRFQTDFRLNDVAASHRREQRQGAVYDLVFMLSGLLALLGGGLVNVNIQLAALRERVRERVPGGILRVSVTGNAATYLSAMHRRIAVGRGLTEVDQRQRSPVAVLGASLAARILGGADPVGREIVLDGIPFRVVGVLTPMETFNADMWLDANGVLVPLETFADRLDPQRRLASVAVKLRAVRDMEAVSSLMLARARRAHHGIEDLEVKNLDAASVRIRAEFQHEMRGWKGVLLSLAGTVLLVGGVGVLSVMLISCADRRFEIGLRKALGASDREILGQFLLEAAVLSILGALAGTCAGVAACAVFASRFPHGLTVDPLWLATAWAVALALGLGFGLYPALRAMRLSPIEAMR